jgi:hypothetical protein
MLARRPGKSAPPRVLALFHKVRYFRVMPPRSLSPASTDEIEQALAHALQFDGRRQFRVSGELMAKITASHLAECLRRAGFVIMKSPPAAPPTAPCDPPA